MPAAARRSAVARRWYLTPALARIPAPGWVRPDARPVFLIWAADIGLPDHWGFAGRPPVPEEWLEDPMR